MASTNSLGFTNEPIAVIGSGCRFPGGADTPSKLWELLSQPKDLAKKIPKERFNVDSFYNPDGTHHGRTSAQYAYMLEENIRAFDASFFNIQPHEAEVIDPQQRLLLETVYEAVSAAGLKVEDLQGSPTAMYVGMMTHDFETNVTHDLDDIPTYTATGISSCIASNRVSYFFDWHGPSMTIDTACSSSLVAVHLAVQQLRSGSSKVAVAAGANLILSPMPFVLESKLNMLSPTGKSRMWDAAADGYARGEGVSSVVLKTLSQALRDGDQIESIIRETGVNQDGHTTGITMPNNDAQKALIHEVYSKAGLDLAHAQNRPQFFEAHGTGTPAGDPKEAEAISTAFFGHKLPTSDQDPLYVGSVKTVIGHTEGTAGIAGLLKASLALQNGVIPPNLLFENVNPRVAPFYQGLCITNEAKPWPLLAPGQPRRASVNSFGFGGTNAHIILESYTNATHQERLKNSEVSAAPLTFSAKSERSLKALLEDMVHLLKTNPEFQMQDLGWTLLHKRSVHPVRCAIAGPTREAALLALQSEIASIEGKMGSAITSETKAKPLILGVFTGQGAQWPAMGKALVSEIPYARDIIAQLDKSLSTLPPEYRPTWTLYDQLLLEGDASNVKNASFSQPLCCAVQILLINLLKAAGLEFKAVVGHSSGEIACAYAAGFISATQAIRIAYLRGVVTKYATSPSGSEGAMLAAGSSYEDALELCALEQFEGRVCVAASNGPDSVTISGDLDAIQEIQEVLEDESKFHRMLKVDKAYHSHHMRPCSLPYLTALEACGCAGADATSPPSSVWISSVYEGKTMTLGDVTGEYWKDNLISPVLFSQAIEQAVIEYAPLDVGIEVGSHPALQGPCLNTIENTVYTELPYTGCMQRGKNDVVSFANALGYLWERFGSEGLDMNRFNTTISPKNTIKSLTKILPQYNWDHSRSYWAESRAARAHLHGDVPHVLLGKLSANNTTSTLQWKNFVRPRDIEWLDGHGLQGQTVFPGAGYIIMAMEAALHVAAISVREVQLLEVLDLKIDKAITFDDENSLVEINLTAHITSEPLDTDRIGFNFSIDSCLAKESGLSSSAKGQLIVTCGPFSSQALPPAQAEGPHMTKVNLGSFYKELAAIGYEYSKDFRGINVMKRADSKAIGTLKYPKLEDRERSIVLHPATLDLSFQTLICAYSAPGDRRLRSLYVPTSIKRVALVPSLCASLYESLDEVHFNSSVGTDRGDIIGGDIEVFEPNSRFTLFQVEDIVFKPFSAPSAADDHRMFSKWTWGELMPHKLLDDPSHWATDEDKEVMPLMERIVYYYIRTSMSQLNEEARASAAPHHKMLINWCEHILAEAKHGRHPQYDVLWEVDAYSDIQKLCEKYIHHPHVRLIQRTGENFLEMILNDKNPFELMDHDGLLTEFYTNPLSFGPSLHYLQELFSQISHRYQTMDILEIGAGTGGATKYVLGTNQVSFNSYTFTDISTGFFDQAREEFLEHEDRMEFIPLDIRRKPEEQGFKPHSYDLIIASNVLHATPKLEETLANARSLLKPGGQLIILEIAHHKHSRLGFIFGLFPDWWAGADEGRILEPYVSLDKWENLLCKVGFSGIDSRNSDRDSAIFPTSLFSTHAINQKTLRLSDPLSAPLKDSYPSIVIVGANSLTTISILDELQRLLPHRVFNVVKRLQDIHEADLERNSSFVVLSDLDDELFSGLDEDKFEAVKTIFFYAKHVLWLTENAWVEHPHQAMTIGLIRSVRLEHADVHAQVLDIDVVKDLNTTFLAEQLLRLEVGSDLQEDGMMWTEEPEIYVLEKRVYVPRLKHDISRNNRLNSSRRQIMTEVNLSEYSVNLRHTDTGAYLESMESTFALHTDATYTTVQVQYALAKTFRVGNLGYFYLVQGNVLGSDKVVVALSVRNASILQIPTCHVVDTKQPLDTCALLPIASDLIAQALLSGTPRGASVVLFEPPQFCVDRVTIRATSMGILVKFASTQPLPQSGAELWINFHKKETDKGLVRALPANLFAFYNFSRDNSPVSIGQRLTKCVPPSCSVYQGDYLAQEMPAVISGEKDQMSRVILPFEEAVHAKENPSLPVVAKMIPADHVVTLLRPYDFTTTIDWKASNSLAALVRPIDSTKLFADDKTYLLVGLAGDLGRSLCRWMIMHGARHVVLSSRNPQIDPRWIDEMKKLNGNVMALAMNVANEDAVDKGLATIRESMPAIGGVAFGPLVLQDILFENMDLDMMEMVLEPKVKGAHILNERLSDPAHPLDFFVMFSSIVMVLGNPGQSAYSAANAYMHGLAQHRRSRGLAGSTIDIGAVYGVGYVTRAGREEEFDAVRFLFDAVSEHELHALFAEAFVAGRPGTPNIDVEVVTGMPFIDPAHRDNIPFFDDPRLGFFRLPDLRGKAGDAANSKGSVKDRLSKATTMDEVRQIVMDGLADKLRTTLQIPADDSVNLVTPLIDQGVDSLGAVTVGTWFSKQLNLDLPLLKILGGASVTDLAEEAADRLPSATIPLVQSADLEASAELGTSSSPTIDASKSESSDNLPTGYDTPLTEPSSWLANIKDDQMKSQDTTVVRQDALSLSQEHFWNLQKQADDPTVFNSTIGMYMDGYIDLNRLSRALSISLHRHEAFRTCFLEFDGKPVQAIMKDPSVEFEAVPVADRSAAEEGFKKLERHNYDISVGETLKLVDFYWSPNNHLLVIAYNRLVGDGSTTENLFVEIGQLYNGIELPRPSQFSGFASRQRLEYETGRMDADIAYWESLYKVRPEVLPVMPLPQAQSRGPIAWDQHTLSVRLNPMIAIRIKERSRKHKATPMHFYLSAFHVLLARLTGSSDISIGVADTNRTNLEDLSTMGYFANLLPVRLAYSTSDTFGEELIATKEHMRAALLHSRVPYSVTLERLGLTGAPFKAPNAPLFQAVFDYKQGQAESGSIGDAKIGGVLASRECTPYDVVLEMSDDPTKDPLITIKLQSSLYGPEDAQVVVNGYLAVLSIFSRNPALRVEEGKLDQTIRAAKTLYEVALK